MIYYIAGGERSGKSMEVHSQTQVGKKFTELQGWMNQYISKNADKAIFMVSGLPIHIK